MTTVGTGDLEPHPTSERIALVAATESIVGPILLGLFAFVLRNRLRRGREGATLLSGSTVIWWVVRPGRERAQLSGQVA